NVLYEEDHFHPNNLGYQLMANAVRDQLIETQNQWLEKEDDQ
ncbi:lipase, partial [Enterococcus faecium]